MLRSTEIVYSVYVVSCMLLEPAPPVSIKLLSPCMATSASGAGLALCMAAEYSPIQQVTLSMRPMLIIFSNYAVNLAKLFDGDIKLFIELMMLQIIVATCSEVF